MIPKPKCLEKHLEVGSEQQLSALRAWSIVSEEENRAHVLKTGCAVAFFKGRKLVFKTVFRNRDTADRMTAVVHQAEVKNWKYNEVLFTNVRKEGQSWVKA